MEGGVDGLSKRASEEGAGADWETWAEDDDGNAGGASLMMGEAVGMAIGLGRVR